MDYIGDFSEKNPEDSRDRCKFTCPHGDGLGEKAAFGVWQLFGCQNKPADLGGRNGTIIFFSFEYVVDDT